MREKILFFDTFAIWTAGSVSASAFARSSLFSWTYSSFTSYDASTGTISCTNRNKGNRQKHIILPEESVWVSIHVATLPLRGQKWEDKVSQWQQKKCTFCIRLRIFSLLSLEAGQSAVGCTHWRYMSQSLAPALELQASRTQSQSQWNLRKAEHY